MTLRYNNKIDRENSLYYLHTKLARRHRKPNSSVCGLEAGLVIFIAVCFSVIALTQTLELRRLSYEAEAVSADLRKMPQISSEIAQENEAYADIYILPITAGNT